jgi:hypothetical protein
MADAHFVVDIATGNVNVGEHQIGDRKAFNHLVNDQCADILVGADRFVASLLYGGTKRSFPETIEVGLVGRFVSGCSTVALVLYGITIKQMGGIVISAYDFARPS